MDSVALKRRYLTNIMTLLHNLAIIECFRLEFGPDQLTRQVVDNPRRISFLQHFGKSISVAEREHNIVAPAKMSKPKSYKLY